MQLVLCAVDKLLADAWQKFCGDLEFVTIHRGSILELNCDAIVSPANSFGFMDGGLDMLYSQHFGWQIQERLQQAIIKKYHGELLIGMAEIVETDNTQIPYIIAAPTMRVPMILKDSINPYLAARAVLLLIKYGIFENGILEGELISQAVQTVAFPGLGTGVGRIGVNTCAYQVRKAIEVVLLEKDIFPQSWLDAQQRHQKLYTSLLKDIQFE
ncbi:MAG: macro domain-containing protein [Cyanobacteria bacterium SBLK]|nr:macro domain-containing protein [Cyanobacteria bacterium SBLK]